MVTTPKLLCQNVPLVEAAHTGGRQRPLSILIRPSWTTGDKGAANAIAQTWHNPNNRIESCHYVIDDGQTIRCLPDNVASLSGGANFKGAITINICYNPPGFPTDATLSRSARLIASLCKRYSFPVRVIPKVDRKWLWYTKGIVFDTPRGFPVSQFVAQVQEEYDKL